MGNGRWSGLLLFALTWLVVSDARAGGELLECRKYPKVIEGRIEGNVTIGPGERVCLINAEVLGSVHMEKGAVLNVAATQIRGDLIASEPAGLRVNIPSGTGGGYQHRVHIDGNLIVWNARFAKASGVCDASYVRGVIAVIGSGAENEKAMFAIGDRRLCQVGDFPNIVDGGVIAVGNRMRISMAGNRIKGALTCLANEPAPEQNGPCNSASRGEGQCAGLVCAAKERRKGRK